MTTSACRLFAAFGFAEQRASNRKFPALCFSDRRACITDVQTLASANPGILIREAASGRKIHPLIAVICAALLSQLTGCDMFHQVTRAEAVQLMGNPNSPDARREGIAALATRWKDTLQPPFTTKFQDIAQHDPDYIVRAMAIRALNIARDKSATKIFIAGLDDQSDAIRLESAKALANVPDPEAIPALTARLEGEREMISDGHAVVVSEDKDIRIAAADALRHYRTLDVAHTLVRYLNEPDFGIAWQSRQSLIALTGRDLSYDENAWLQFLVGPGGPFG